MDSTRTCGKGAPRTLTRAAARRCACTRAGARGALRARRGCSSPRCCLCAVPPTRPLRYVARRWLSRAPRRWRAAIGSRRARPRAPTLWRASACVLMALAESLPAGLRPACLHAPGRAGAGRAGARSGRPPMQADRGRHASRAPRHASPLWALGSIVTSCADASSREGHAMGSCPRASIVCAIGAHASGMASRHHRPHGARAQVALCEHRLGTIAAAAAVVPGEQLGGAAVAAALAEAGGAGGDGGRADAGAGAAAARPPCSAPGSTGSARWGQTARSRPRRAGRHRSCLGRPEPLVAASAFAPRPAGTPPAGRACRLCVPGGRSGRARSPRCPRLGDRRAPDWPAAGR